MKIAIPTNDGINIAENTLDASGFLILSVEFGEILKEEIRWKNTEGKKNITETICDMINDCPTLLVSKVSDNASPQLSGLHIIPVKETIITNIIVNYLSETLHKEANTCCCP
jgi:predicted Fe-Mo cluster-binding NifX family protein